MKITVPTGSQSVIGKDGTVNPAWYTLFQKLANASNTLNDAVGITRNSVSATESSLSGSISRTRSALEEALGSTSSTLTSQIEAQGATLADGITALSEQVGALVIPDATQLHGEHVTIDYADDRAYPIVQFSECAWTILAVVAKCSTGSCTVTVDIDGTPLGGGANSVSTTEGNVGHSTANAVSVGSTITVTISSNSSAELVAVSIVGERELATL